MSIKYDHGGNIFSVARQRGMDTSRAADFSASINPLGISPAVRHAIVDAIDSLIHYPDNNQSELKSVLSEVHTLAPDCFAVANGSTEIIYNLPAMMSGKRAVIVSPAFSEYGYALGQHKWDVIPFILSHENGFELDMGQLEQAVEKGCDALYLCNPGNPSGKLYSRELVAEVYELCRNNGVFFVLDEAFMDFCEDQSAKDAVVASPNGIVLRSMTKFFGIPGLRLGYAMAAPEVIARLSLLGGPWSVNTLAQAAGIAALHDHEYTRRTVTYVEQERSFLSEGIAAVGCLQVFESRANFLLVRIDADTTSTELRERLLEKWIMIRDCVTFTGLSDKFFRVAVRTREENTRLLEALRDFFGA
ncbi:MAG TPA: threonine-phosphate decarboxylase CobD [Deltaproteobacteria bacterium]|nr:threonine-phosphate decarboxylase CobD [Deltaproteobacteria bacterium]